MSAIPTDMDQLRIEPEVFNAMIEGVVAKWSPGTRVKVCKDVRRGEYIIQTTTTLDEGVLQDAIYHPSEGIKDQVYTTIRNIHHMYEDSKALKALEGALLPIAEMIGMKSINLRDDEDMSCLIVSLKQALKHEEAYVAEVDDNGEKHHVHLSPVELYKSPNINVIESKKEPKSMIDSEGPLVVPGVVETLRNGLKEGVKRSAVSALVMAVKVPVISLTKIVLGNTAAKKLNTHLSKPIGDAVFTMAVGGLGLGAQAIGITGKFSKRLNGLCEECIAQGSHGGAKDLLQTALWPVIEAYMSFDKVCAAFEDEPVKRALPSTNAVQSTILTNTAAEVSS